MLQAVSPDDPDGHGRRAAAAGAPSAVSPITASLHDGRAHLLLAASGSVATIKLPLIIRALSRHANLSIRVVLTAAAARFLAGQSGEQPAAAALAALPRVAGVHVDADEWREPWRRGDAILHIELRRWADLLVVAPLSANTMAKLVAGIADGLLTSVVRAWDARAELDDDDDDDDDAAAEGEGGPAAAAAEKRPGRRKKTKKKQKKKKKRIVVACAMNTAMWRHPVTAKQLRVLEEEWGVGGGADGGDGDDADGDDADGDDADGDDADGDDGDGWFEVLRPQRKTLACGDVGDGAMAEWSDIVKVIERRLGLAG